MRALKIANLVVAASLLLASFAHGLEIGQVTGQLPRAFIGEFTWEGDKASQNVVITLESVRALNDQNVEALGCGSYESNREVTMIRVRMFVRLSDLYVEIVELSPQGSASFETDGSHRGHLSNDLQSIEADWTTRSSGRKGRLSLRAASSAVCAPASSL